MYDVSALIGDIFCMFFDAKWDERTQKFIF